MLTRVYSATLHGVNATPVCVEVDATGFGNETKINIIGLPDTAIRESRSRVKSALNNSGYIFPSGYTTISLSPASLRKEGSAFDLPIALAFISTVDYNNLNPLRLAGVMAVGELTLDGTIKPIRGALAMAVCARDNGYHTLIVPSENAKEAAIVDGITVYAASHIKYAVDLLNNRNGYTPEPKPNWDKLLNSQQSRLDFSDVKGQVQARRALEIACAGFHNILLIGPPGAGKSMLAKRLPSIMPLMHLQESLDTTRIHSIGGILTDDKPLLIERPFRSPHHTISDVALLGGGSTPGPGEVSYAHNGVLFLDELPEFKRQVLEVLRQPLEDGTVHVSRAAGSFAFPADFMLVAAMNPCPCGFHGTDAGLCRCTPFSIERYRSRISGPLLDRIDLQVSVRQLSENEMLADRTGENSLDISKRVRSARVWQYERLAKHGFLYNSQMGSKELDAYCQPDNSAKNYLRQMIKKLSLSARAYDRILKLARTIADLDSSIEILYDHICEAVQYRQLDRQ